MNKRVFVIIVTYNGAQWMQRNLQSLRESDYPVEVIVVDNNSTDSTLEKIGDFPEVMLIRSAENLGFGKANTIGIKKALEAGADYLFLLNQDTWVYPATIGHLVTTQMDNPEYGIVSPVHLGPDEKIQDANFAQYLSRKTAQKGDVVTVPFVNAAAWLVSRICIETVGSFEPLFGHYGEDRNYSDRVHYHKFKIGIALDAIICHDRTISRSFKKDVIQSQYTILATLLDINYSFTQSSLRALKAVVGLPKYFVRFYGFAMALKLFVRLAWYYFKTILNLRALQHARAHARKSPVL